jgi:sensor histidine kinase regulating citrate/malate metabolism
MEMLRTILRNLSDNAARATRECGQENWGIEAYADSDSLEVVLSNPCKDIEIARQHIESATSGSSNEAGTGVGVMTARRLIGRLIGDLKYEFDGNTVKATLVIPIGPDVAAGLVESVVE